jgi:hypothetical protein
MPPVRTTCSVITALVNPFGMAILGAVVTLTLTSREAIPPDEHPIPARAGRAVVRDEEGIVHVNLDVARSDASTNLMVHDAGGRELGTFLLNHDGTMTFEPTGSDPGRFHFHRSRSMAVRLSTSGRHARFQLNAQPDGSADVLVTDAVGKPMFSVRVSEHGDVTTHRSKPDP